MTFSNLTDSAIGELARTATVLINELRVIIKEAYELQKKGKL